MRSKAFYERPWCQGYGAKEAFKFTARPHKVVVIVQFCLDSGHGVAVRKDVERLNQRFVLFVPHDHSCWTALCLAAASRRLRRFDQLGGPLPANLS